MHNNQCLILIEIHVRHAFTSFKFEASTCTCTHTLVRSTQLKLIWISRNTSENANWMPIIFAASGCLCSLCAVCTHADQDSTRRKREREQSHTYGVCVVVYFVNNNNNSNNSIAFQSHQINSLDAEKIWKQCIACCAICACNSTSNRIEINELSNDVFVSFVPFFFKIAC